MGYWQSCVMLRDDEAEILIEPDRTDDASRTCFRLCIGDYSGEASSQSKIDISYEQAMGLIEWMLDQMFEGRAKVEIAKPARRRRTKPADPSDD